MAETNVERRTGMGILNTLAAISAIGGGISGIIGAFAEDDQPTGLDIAEFQAGASAKQRALDRKASASELRERIKAEQRQLGQRLAAERGMQTQALGFQERLARPRFAAEKTAAEEAQKLAQLRSGLRAFRRRS